MIIPANLLIIGITVLVSILAFQSDSLFNKLKFNAYYIKKYKDWTRLFTSGFVHADFMHLFFNMFVLYMFGPFVEDFFIKLVQHELLGGLVYLLFYLIAVPMSSLYSLEKHKNDEWYNAVGASGAVSAVLFSSIVLYPMQKIGILFIPVGIPGFVFGILYLAYSWYMGKRGQDNIGHDAHFFGAIFGIVATLLCDFSLLNSFIQQIIN